MDALLRDRLLGLVRAETLHGNFSLSSGEVSDIYVDLRRVSHTAAGFRLIGMALGELTGDWDYDAVGGLAIGAVPVALAVGQDRDIPAFTVRKEVKGHGTRGRVEGMDVAGKRVLIVDDVVTTGASAAAAAAAARAAGASVVGLATVLDRQGWRPTYGFRSLFTLKDLRNG